MQYLIRRARATPELAGHWDGPAWKNADVATLASFHPAGSDHRPVTRAKLLYDHAGVYVMFHVSDRYVVCTSTQNQSATCRDSCVEVYFEPEPGKSGYFNFEMNCGGAQVLFYVTDPRRDPENIFRAKEVVPQSLLDTIRVYHSMPKTVPAEITEPVEWTVEFFVPSALFERYAGKLPPPEQRRWHGNFHKCADESSHPHWASWSPIQEELNFHVPATFGRFHFET
ncbi:MAG: carbohydrate-binding family 9-like protein [Tepidisphaeraceae bacterium]